MTRPIRLFLILQLAASPAAAQGPSSTPAATAAFNRADGMALQGEIRPALAILRSVPASEFSARAARMRFCIMNRFMRPPDATPPAGLPETASRALARYRAYWRAALLEPSRRDAEEGRLRDSLAGMLGLPTASEMTAVETALTERLAGEGVTALTGRTPPLREFMLWRTQRIEQREVALPEGNHRVRVVFLDDFASFGWSAYATCDRRLSAGWVRPDGIYAVAPAWGDLQGEDFQVSFLGHETQHFADKERFGELQSWELEYRAKLAELVLARTSLAGLLQAFANNQGDDPDIAHSYANKRVLADLRTHAQLSEGANLAEVRAGAISAAALAALRADSLRRAQTSSPSS